jgi:phosphonate transport system substrate-binding protein
VIKAWKDKGGKTCAESRAMPIKQWLVLNTMPASTATSIQDALLGMDSTALGYVGYKSFIASAPDKERALTTWLDIH